MITVGINLSGFVLFAEKSEPRKGAPCAWNAFQTAPKSAESSAKNGHPNGEKQKVKGLSKTSASAKNAEKLRAFVSSVEKDPQKKGA